MNFSDSMKVFELNILRQSGVMVTAQQVGLKSDPILALQSQSLNNGTYYGTYGTFSNTLSQIGMTQPVMPTMPTDTTNTAAMATYQQQMAAYSQSMQLYNQRFMQVLLNQMQQMQQSVSNASNSSSNSTPDVAGSMDTSSALGVGGIL